MKPDATVTGVTDPLTGEPLPPETPGESSTPPVEPPADDAVQKRINTITAEKYGHKRRADAAEARVAELEGKSTPTEPTEAPKLEDFDFDETKFNQAVISYQVKQELAASATETKRTAATATRKQLADTFTAKEVEFGATTSDYGEKVANIPQLHPDTLDVVYGMENGPQLAYYLGSNPEVADKIASAHPMNAAVELGRIAAQLAATTKTVETSNAPAPVDTLTGSGGVGKSQDEMSMDEIMAL